MRQDQLLRAIEEEARIEADYFAPDMFDDYVMTEAEAKALSIKSNRNKPTFVPKSLPTRRKAA